jgi:hypothetical protein
MKDEEIGIRKQTTGNKNQESNMNREDKSGNGKVPRTDQGVRCLV